MVAPREMSQLKSARLELQEVLANHTKMGDAKKVLSTLKNASFLTSVPLEPISSNKIKAAEKQVAAESASINGIKTVADSRNFGTLRLLRDLSHQLCHLHELDLNPQHIYETIIMRMSKTLASVDSYSRLRRIIRASNLSLIRDDITAKYTANVEVFESDGSLHATIATPCAFGLVKNADLKPGHVDINTNGLLVNQKRGSHVQAWVKFNVIVIERINFSTGESVRIARLV